MLNFTEIGILVRIQGIGEQLIDIPVTVVAWRQTDTMDDNQANVSLPGTIVIVGRFDPPDIADPLFFLIEFDRHLSTVPPA